jgi:hypothetical protein
LANSTQQGSSSSSPPDGAWTDLKQPSQFSNATSFLIPHPRNFGAAFSREGRGPAADTPPLTGGGKTPLQAMKDWHKLKPELFKKQPYYRPGCDR